MIEDPPLLQIRRSFVRPTSAQIDAFRGLQTGYVVDAMNGRGALDGRIKPIADSGAFCGAAIPCHAGPADNLAVFGALSICQAGDVIVCGADAFTETAVVGDLLLGMIKNRGAAAFVTDGFVRDLPGIKAVALPCYAAGVTPNSPARNGPGTVGLPIVIGGVVVNAGDIVIGDQDGVVIVPAGMIEQTIGRLPAIRAAEAELDAKVKAGLDVPGFIQEMIDAGRFTEVS